MADLVFSGRLLALYILLLVSDIYMVEAIPTDRDLIVNGNYSVKREEFLFYVTSAAPRPGLCGGSLVHEDVFLTAAHCHGVFSDG